LCRLDQNYSQFNGFGGFRARALLKDKGKGIKDVQKDKGRRINEQASGVRPFDLAQDKLPAAVRKSSFKTLTR
jgi:hypothetical protein